MQNLKANVPLNSQILDLEAVRLYGYAEVNEQDGLTTCPIPSCAQPLKSDRLSRHLASGHIDRYKPAVSVSQDKYWVPDALQSTMIGVCNKTNLAVCYATNSVLLRDHIFPHCTLCDACGCIDWVDFPEQTELSLICNDPRALDKIPNTVPAGIRAKTFRTSIDFAYRVHEPFLKPRRAKFQRFNKPATSVNDVDIDECYKSVDLKLVDTPIYKKPSMMSRTEQLKIHIMRCIQGINVCTNGAQERIAERYQCDENEIFDKEESKAVGYSFIIDTRNNFTSEVLKLEDAIDLEHLLAEIKFEDSVDVDAHLLVCYELELAIAQLMKLVTGLSMPTLLSLNYINTEDSERHLVFIGGKMVYTIGKSERVQIPFYLAELIARYLIMVRPLQGKLLPHVYDDDPALFATTDPKEFTSDAKTHMKPLNLYSLEHSMCVEFSSWQQLKIDDMETIECNAVVRSLLPNLLVPHYLSD